MRRKAQKPTVDPRKKLTGDFVAALQADWNQHGAEIIEMLRKKAPTKYAEIISRFALPDPWMDEPSAYSEAKSMDDVGRIHLSQVGIDDPTDKQVEMALAAHNRFIQELEMIAAVDIAIKVTEEYEERSLRS